MRTFQEIVFSREVVTFVNIVISQTMYYSRGAGLSLFFLIIVTDVQGKVVQLSGL